MSDVVLRTNAIPVYGFFSIVQAARTQSGLTTTPRILDCGAGGAVPPLALFAQHGYEAYGIDISEQQLERSRNFCAEQRLAIDFRLADMRQIPFDDNTFDYVYEHYSLCHLNHADTEQAVSEMLRVLKPGGMCFLGVISMDSWPHAKYGEQRAPGVYVGAEGNSKDVTHSLWTEERSDRLVAAWEMVDKEKTASYMLEMADNASLEEWMKLINEAPQGVTAEAWRAAYPRRREYYKYVHTYYYLRKPN